MREGRKERAREGEEKGEKKGEGRRKEEKKDIKSESAFFFPSFSICRSSLCRSRPELASASEASEENTKDAGQTRRRKPQHLLFQRDASDVRRCCSAFIFFMCSGSE